MMRRNDARTDSQAIILVCMVVQDAVGANAVGYGEFQPRPHLGKCLTNFGETPNLELPPKDHLPHTI